MSVPSPAELSALLLNVVVRDYPETLAVLRRSGVDVARRGGVSLGEVVREAGDEVLDRIIAAIAWRAEEK